MQISNTYNNNPNFNAVKGISCLNGFNPLNNSKHAFVVNTFLSSDAVQKFSINNDFIVQFGCGSYDKLKKFISHIGGNFGLQMSNHSFFVRLLPEPLENKAVNNKNIVENILFANSGVFKNQNDAFKNLLYKIVTMKYTTLQNKFLNTLIRGKDLNFEDNISDETIAEVIGQEAHWSDCRQCVVLSDYLTEKNIPLSYAD